MGAVAEVAPNAEGGKTELTSATCGSNGALGEDSAVVRKEEGEVLENTAVKGACVNVVPGTAVDSERSHGQGTLENTQNLDADHLNPDTRSPDTACHSSRSLSIRSLSLDMGPLVRHGLPTFLPSEGRKVGTTQQTSSDLTRFGTDVVAQRPAPSVRRLHAPSRVGPKC